MSAFIKGMVAAVVVATALAAASAASAATRYASPTGTSSTGNCTSPDPSDPTNPPCTLIRANNFSVDGDELLIAPGDYDIGAGNLLVTNAVDVHGADDQPPPRIISSASNFGVAINDPGAMLRHVEIDYSGPLEALSAFSSLLIERVVAKSSGSLGCIIEDNTTFRDGVCFSSGAGGIGAKVGPSGGTATANLRNVTAVATGSTSRGILVSVPNNGDQETLVAKNVIADGVSADVGASAGSASSVATATMSTSNYATQEETGIGTPTVTDPGTGTNQTAAPLFADAGTGLFHQASGSPTIDGGATVDLMGALDLDGNARLRGAAPDIGADEFVPLVAPPPTGTTTAPPPTATTTFDLAAAIRHCKKKFRKETKKRKRCIKRARGQALAIAGT